MFRNVETKRSSAQFFGLRGHRLKTAMLVLIVAPSLLFFGFNVGASGGIIALESFVKTFPAIDTVNTTGSVKAHNATILGVVAPIYDLGAVLGALSCILYSDKIGRLRTIACGMILGLVSLAIQSSAYSLAQLIVGRILVGAAVGITSASVPVWQTECSTTKHRGIFVIMEGIFISGGIAMSEWVSLGLFFAWSNSAQWRVTLVFPAVFAIFVLPLLMFMPESPRWLARRGRINEARVIIAAIMDKEVDSHEVNAEINHIQWSLEQSKGSLKLLFTNSKERYAHRAVLAALCQAMTQLCGCSALIFYTSVTFTDLGFTGTPGRLLGCGFTTTFTVCALIPLFIVDRIGRKKLFLISLSGMCVSMAVMAGTSGNPERAVVSVVFMFIYACSYPIGFLGLPFLYAGEIAGLRMRVPITAIAVSCQWLGQFVVGQITPPGTTNLGSRYWIIFAVLNAAYIPVVFFFFPETNGRSLEEIDDIFSRSGTFSVVKNARELPREMDVDIMDLEKRFKPRSEQSASEPSQILDSDEKPVYTEFERVSYQAK